MLAANTDMQMGVNKRALRRRFLLERRGACYGELEHFHISEHVSTHCVVWMLPVQETGCYASRSTVVRWYDFPTNTDQNPACLINEQY
jgi:hypothetical protein